MVSIPAWNGHRILTRLVLDVLVGILSNLATTGLFILIDMGSSNQTSGLAGILSPIHIVAMASITGLLIFLSAILSTYAERSVESQLSAIEEELVQLRVLLTAFLSPHPYLSPDGRGSPQAIRYSLGGAIGGGLIGSAFGLSFGFLFAFIPSIVGAFLGDGAVSYVSHSAGRDRPDLDSVEERTRERFQDSIGTRREDFEGFSEGIIDQLREELSDLKRDIRNLIEDQPRVIETRVEPSFSRDTLEQVTLQSLQESLAESGIERRQEELRDVLVSIDEKIDEAELKDTGELFDLVLSTRNEIEMLRREVSKLEDTVDEMEEFGQLLEDWRKQTVPSEKVLEDAIELLQIPGVGPKRARALIQAGFTDLEAIRKASIDELREVTGIGKGTARQIKRNT